MPGKLGPISVSTKQQRIAELARQMPEKAMTSLSHHMDLEWMIEAYRRTRKDGAVGIDGQTGQDYALDLEANLHSLLDRAKSGDLYKAPMVRRVHIPKADGTTRPLGITTFEDKVLQRAVIMAMEPIYEHDFMDCSYGFRPERSAHHAIEAIRSRLLKMGGGFVLDVDIRRYFDSLNHTHLRDFLAKRMRDGVITRLIGKWLSAGVMDAGCIFHPETGTPQGGVASPLLANIYLHEVLDVWFEKEVKPRLRGLGFLVRYADDFVMGFTYEEDARKVLDVLPKRFGKYGLELHPDKTRMLDFRSPRYRIATKDKDGPGSFSFLGFTFYWAKSLKGNWVVKQKTSKKSFTKALQSIREWCRSNRHLPLKEQQQTLTQKLKGHYAYFGLPGNSSCLGGFCHEVKEEWWKWLKRRSQAGYMSWLDFCRLLDRYPLPRPVMRHRILIVANP